MHARAAVAAALLLVCSLATGVAAVARPGFQPAPGGTGQVEPCPTGTAKKGAGNFACLKCSGVGASGSPRYQPYQGQTACLECGNGVVNAARTSCTAGPGFEPGGIGMQPQPCRAGYAKKGPGNFACGLCSGQRFQPNKGQSACLTCAAGGTPNAAHTACIFRSPPPHPPPTSPPKPPPSPPSSPPPSSPLTLSSTPPPSPPPSSPPPAPPPSPPPSPPPAPPPSPPPQPPPSPPLGPPPSPPPSPPPMPPPSPPPEPPPSPPPAPPPSPPPKPPPSPPPMPPPSPPPSPPPAPPPSPPPQPPPSPPPSPPPAPPPLPEGSTVRAPCEYDSSPIALAVFMTRFGIPGLAILGSTGDLAVCVGNGDGTFSAASLNPISGNHRVVQPLDFNNDGLQDLLVGNAAPVGQPSIFPYQGIGNGSFTALASDSSSDTPAFLAVTRGPPQRVFVANAPASGPGTLAAYDINSIGGLTAINQVSTGSGSSYVTLAGASQQWALVAIPSTNTILVYVVDPSGALSGGATNPTGNQPVCVVATPDNTQVAVACQLSNTVQIFGFNPDTGALTSTAVVPVGNSPRRIAVGDFNGDGAADYAVTNYNSNTISVLLSLPSGSGQLGVPISYSTCVQPTDVHAADFNGDGAIDLVVACSGDGQVVPYLGNGAGGFTAAPVVGS